MKPQLPNNFELTKQDKQDFRKFAEKATFIIKFFLYGLISGLIILLTAFIRSWLR